MVGPPAINPSTLVCLPVSYPLGNAEQHQIAAFLGWKMRQIDALIAKGFAIARLTEYRTALITAATTGKIDVREAAIPGYAKQQADGDNSARSPLPEPA